MSREKFVMANVGSVLGGGKVYRFPVEDFVKRWARVSFSLAGLIGVFSLLIMWGVWQGMFQALQGGSAVEVYGVVPMYSVAVFASVAFGVMIFVLLNFAKDDVLASSEGFLGGLDKKFAGVLFREFGVVEPVLNLRGFVRFFRGKQERFAFKDKVGDEFVCSRVVGDGGEFLFNVAKVGLSPVPVAQVGERVSG